MEVGAKNHSFNRNPIYKIQINCRYQIVWLDFALTLAFVFRHKNIIMGNLLRDLQNLCIKKMETFPFGVGDWVMLLQSKTLLSEPGAV